MKASLALVALAACTSNSTSDAPAVDAAPPMVDALPDPVGDPFTVALIDGQLYAVRSIIEWAQPSEEGDQVGDFENSTNIFTLRGDTDGQGRTTVYLFGTGYGSGDDQAAYRPQHRVRVGYLDADVGDELHFVIANHFGLASADVDIQQLIPHMHHDHAHWKHLERLELEHGYSILPIKVHDEDRSIDCVAACCDIAPCRSDAPMWGVPFSATAANGGLFPYAVESEAWTNTDCEFKLDEFSTPSGTWQVQSQGDDHSTSGPIMLVNPDLAPPLTLLGAAKGGCGSSLSGDLRTIHSRNILP